MSARRNPHRVGKMRTTAYDDKAAHEIAAAAGSPLSPGIYDAVIDQAYEKLSAKNNETIELSLKVDDGRGGHRIIKDWLTNSAIGALKLRQCCAACGNEVLRAYEMGEVSQELFPGHTLRLKLGVEKPRGFRPRNVVLAYLAADSSVINLRARQ